MNNTTLPLPGLYRFQYCKDIAGEKHYHLNRPNGIHLINVMFSEREALELCAAMNASALGGERAREFVRELWCNGLFDGTEHMAWRKEAEAIICRQDENLAATPVMGGAEAGLKLAAEAIQSEKLTDNTGDPTDLAYNRGCEDCLMAVKRLLDPRFAATPAPQPVKGRQSLNLPNGNKLLYTEQLIEERNPDGHIVARFEFAATPAPQPTPFVVTGPPHDELQFQQFMDAGVQAQTGRTAEDVETLEHQIWLATGMGYNTPEDRANVRALLEAHVQERLAAAPRIGLAEWREVLRRHWSFDEGQQHTHSWHDRENFIEKELPRLLTTAPAQPDLAQIREALEAIAKAPNVNTARAIAERALAAPGNGRGV